MVRPPALAGRHAAARIGLRDSKKNALEPATAMTEGLHQILNVTSPDKVDHKRLRYFKFCNRFTQVKVEVGFRKDDSK